MAKILVIEDEAELRANIGRFLRAEGYEVLTAENGALGVEMAISRLPDLIVCDIAMPEMDGFGVLFSLRENVTTTDIRSSFSPRAPALTTATGAWSWARMTTSRNPSSW